MGPSLSVVVFPTRIAHTSRFDPGVGTLTICAYSRDPFMVRLAALLDHSLERHCSFPTCLHIERDESRYLVKPDS